MIWAAHNSLHREKKKRERGREKVKLKMKVIIIGAGIGGLTLAAALAGSTAATAAQGVDYIVIERDASAGSRPQGYAVGLRGDMGIRALKAVGFSEAELESCGYPTRDFLICSSGGWELMSLRAPRKASPFYNYQVRRQDLRNMLLRKVDSSKIVWDATAISYSIDSAELPGGRGVRVLLSNGQVIDGDMLVVADGAKSRLRKQLLHTQGATDPKLGLMMINGRVDGNWGRHERLNTEKILFALGTGSSVFASMSEDLSSGWSYACHTDPALLQAAPEQQLKLVADKANNWVQPIPTLVAATNPSSLRVIEMLDVPTLTVAHDRRVVLIGDAAHPMTPHRGLGANTAILDAMDLAKVILELQSESNMALNDTAVVEGKLSAFASSMLKRSAPHVAQSRAASMSYHNKSQVGCMARNVSLWFMGRVIALLAAIF